jgi:hypothetical protein
MKRTWFRLINGLALISILLGVTLGIFGTVRAGALYLSLGAAIFIVLRYVQAVPRRFIELIIPLGVCAVLIGMALELPHSK